jgi:hypothetical protein
MVLLNVRMNSPHPQPFSQREKGAKIQFLSLWERVRVREKDWQIGKNHSSIQQRQNYGVAYMHDDCSFNE